MACPALPTCGLALAESERTLPDLMTQLETLLAEFRLQDEEITVRMTGCPNGCARPYTAELAFVGKAPNKYQIYLGGNEGSTRMSRLYKDSVRGDEILQELRPVFLRFFQERQPGERFGDFCARAILA
jgi:sulfite reductase beta subunit-like hemoprotein